MSVTLYLFFNVNYMQVSPLIFPAGKYSEENK